MKGEEKMEGRWRKAKTQKQSCTNRKKGRNEQKEEEEEGEVGLGLCQNTTEHQRRKLTLSPLISPHVLRLSLHSFMRNTLSQPSIELFLLLSSSLSPSLMAMTEPHSPSVPLQSFTSIYLLFKTVLSSVFVRYLSLPSSSPFGRFSAPAMED